MSKLAIMTYQDDVRVKKKEWGQLLFAETFRMQVHVLVFFIHEGLAYVWC